MNMLFFLSFLNLSCILEKIAFGQQCIHWLHFEIHKELAETAVFTFAEKLIVCKLA